MSFERKTLKCVDLHWDGWDKTEGRRDSQNSTYTQS